MEKSYDQKRYFNNKEAICAKAKQQRLDKIEKGICLYCKNLAESDNQVCSEHKKLRKNRRHKERSKKVNNGLCTRCGKISRPNKTRCQDCVDRDKSAELRLKEKRQAARLCRLCGKQAYGLYCEVCSFKRSAGRYLGSWTHWQKLKELFDKQKGLCRYSKRPLIIGVNAEIDHIVAKKKGGTDDISNYQWVHTVVNRMKRDSTEEEFLSLVLDIAQNISTSSY